MEKDDKDPAPPKGRARAKKERGASTRAPVEAQADLSPPPVPPATASPSLRSGTSLPVVVDPLQEFLARYDDGEEAVRLTSAEGAAVGDEERRFLWFDLGGEAYAASIMDVREILKVVTPTEVPRAPREVLGVLSKRGVVMPVVDLAAVLGLRSPDRTLSRDQRVLVVGEGQRVLGLRVDRVHQVVRLPSRALEEVPASLGTKGAHLLLGLGRPRAEADEEARLLILLDVDAVLAHVGETMGVPQRESA